MKKALSILLLLSACGSGGERANNGGGPNPADLEPTLPTLPSAAELEGKAAQALATVLLDSRDARYWNVRPGSGGAICGEVDSRQEDGKFGGPRPFVVTAEGVGVVSPATRVVYGDPGDLFPDFYIRWCATPEELTKLGPGIREEPPADAASSNLTNSADLPLAAPADPVVPPAPVAQPKGEPKTQPKDAAPLKPPSGDDDSFFKAVIRKKDSTVSD